MVNSFKEFLEIIEELEKLSRKKEELLMKAKTLLKKQKNIIEINDNNYDIFVTYQATLHDYTMWQSRKEYFEIITNFLDNKIDGKRFCKQIQNLRYKNTVEAMDIEANLKYKTDIHLTSESINFSKVPYYLNSLIDLFDPDLNDSESSDYALSGNGLRSAIRKTIIPEFSTYL